MRWVFSLVVLCVWFNSVAVAQDGERCVALVGREGQVTRQELVGYSVLNAQPPLTAPVVEGELQAILCGRESTRFAPNDYRVLTDVRVPLYVSDGSRVAVLEISNGQLRVRFATGQMNEAEGQELQQSINEMQSALQGDPR